MGRREKVHGKPGAYVERGEKGQFLDWTNIGRSIHADMRTQAKNHPKKSGYGHQGDYSREDAADLDELAALLNE